jgi:ATP-binding cassette subfamily B multidrug efflux pump
VNFFVRYLRPYFGQMCGGMTIKFTGTIMDLLLPWCLAHIVDDVIPMRNIGLIAFWGVLMAIFSMIAVLGNIIANRMASRVARNTTEAVRRDLFHKIMSLSCAQADHFTIPSLISRLTSDTYNVHSMVGMMQRMGIRAPILLLGGIAVTLTLEPVLALILIACLPLMALVIVTVSRKGIPLYTNLQRGVDKLVQTVRENVTGIRVIKALSKTDYEKRRFDTVNQDVVCRERKAGLTMAVTNPTMNLFLNLGMTLIILVGAYRVNGGISQPGKIIAFMNYFTIILNAVLSINRMFVMCSKGIASAGRIDEVLQTPADMPPRLSEPVADNAHVVFDHVSFSYLKKERNLTDITFSLKRGETLGIIGATGSGKSTIVNLLMRLYEADEGSIRIGGENVNAIPPEVLHTKFGVAFQHDVLFADTIAENISFGRELPEEQLRRAAADAQAAEFIDSLPDGLEHMLTIKGANLSGGQKQRLLIARALAGNPEILILDDSSSALDYKTDAKLRGAIRAHFQGATSIIIAQRVSSILHADHILVLEDGCQIGYGTHQELLESCPVYREISESQMGGGLLA